MEKLIEKICLYIDKNWIKDMSNRAFAIANDIDEITVRRIKEIREEKYSISIKLLKKSARGKGLNYLTFLKWLGNNYLILLSG